MITLFWVLFWIIAYAIPTVYVGRRVFIGMITNYVNPYPNSQPHNEDRPSDFALFGFFAGSIGVGLVWPLSILGLLIMHGTPLNRQDAKLAQIEKGLRK